MSGRGCRRFLFSPLKDADFKVSFRVMDLCIFDILFFSTNAANTVSVCCYKKSLVVALFNRYFLKRKVRNEVGGIGLVCNCICGSHPGYFLRKFCTPPQGGVLWAGRRLGAFDLPGVGFCEGKCYRHPSLVSKGAQKMAIF